MAKTKLKPKCKDLLYELTQRAEQQLLEAYEIYKQHGQLHTYSAPDSTGKQVTYEECLSSNCIVVRKNEYGQLVYHWAKESWFPLHLINEARDLAACADYLLEQAYKIARNGQ